MKITFILRITTLLILLMTFSWTTVAQGDAAQDPIVINIDDIENDPERVEIQRYTGYENLLFRYLTLPYDISANTGRQGRYFDIGYGLLAIFPVALLLLIYKNKRLFYITLVSLLLYLFSSFCYSFVNIDTIGAVNRSDADWSVNSISQNRSAPQAILVSIYNIAFGLSTPLRSMAESFSGDKDHITYPFLFLIFVLLLYFSVYFKKSSWKASFISVVLFVFFFLWLILSGGIIWYGFILIPLLFGISLSVVMRDDSLVNQIPKFAVLFSIACWIILSYGARVSNINNQSSIDNIGKSMVDPSLMYYTAGIHSPSESRDQIYRNISGAFDKINTDNALIYQVGTSTNFEIKNNTERVYQDNILTTFFAYFDAYRNEDIINTVFKPTGFKYIILDLYTPTLDKTPEKSLTKKYRLFLNSLYISKNIKLLATDRVMRITSSTGRESIVNDLFTKNISPDSKAEVVNYGSYAIYEII